MNYSLKQVSDITGLSSDTLRYYEKEGIVATKRQDNGYRFYDDSNLTTLKYVVVLKYAGFSIAELKRMAEPLVSEPGEDCADAIKKILTAKIRELKQAVSNYQKIIMLMEESFQVVDLLNETNADKSEMDGFIDQVFNDIRNDTLFSKEEY